MTAEEHPRLLLSALELEWSSPTFRGALVPWSGSSDYEAEQQKSDRFTYRYRHGILTIPLSPGPTDPTEEQLQTREHLRPLGRLLSLRLPTAAPRLELHPAGKGTPESIALERLNLKDDLLEDAFGHSGLHLLRPKVARLHRYARTKLEPRQVEMNGAQRLVLTVSMSRRHAIDGHLNDWRDLLPHMGGARLRYLGPRTGSEGAELRGGLYLVAAANQESIRVETPAGERDLPAESLGFAPDFVNMKRLIALLIGEEQAARVEAAEDELLGEEYDRRLTKLQLIASWLKKESPFALTDSLSVRIGDLVKIWKRDPSQHVVPPIIYYFSPDRSQSERVPSTGLLTFGPFDRRSFEKKRPRLLVVCPQGAREIADRLVKWFRDGLPLPATRFTKGFTSQYRLQELLLEFLQVPLTSDPGQDAERYVEAIRTRFDPARVPDLVMVLIRDEAGFHEQHNVYRATKAFLLGQGIPSQEIRLSKATSSVYDLQFILEDVALAVYAKLGGTPWTIAPPATVTHEVIFGLAYTESGGRFRSQKRYMGLTTVFKGDGSYMLQAASPRCLYDEYPRVLADLVRDTLRQLKAEFAWRDGDVVRLVFHAVKPLTRDDLRGISAVAREELGASIQHECALITLKDDHPFTLYQPDEGGRAGKFELKRGGRVNATVGRHAPARGQTLRLSPSQYLLVTQGPREIRLARQPIPSPWLLELHPDSDYREMDALVRQAFDFTGLSWRTVRPSSEPVTILYSRLLAEKVAALEGNPYWQDQLLNTRLRRSRWFL